MKKRKTTAKDFSTISVAPSLQQALQTISDQCINCKFCKQECAFLQQYGKPKQIADRFDPNEKKYRKMAFECSLCRLCGAVCPVNINPAVMFLEMRREAVRTRNGNFRKHGTILGYEKRGTSQRYSYYAFPKGCDTVFFPGCSMPGTRPDTTWAVFQHLTKAISNLGIVLDCCTKPSHDLGREAYFNAMFGEMKDYLIQNGIRKVFTACPNCYRIFSEYGGKLSCRTVFEIMAQDGLPTNKQISGTVTMHDPCVTRYEGSIHAAVRELCKRQGLFIEEMPHHKEKTLCCGEGGSVSFIMPDHARKWGALRKAETNGNRTITYCAGCSSFLGSITPTCHVLDLVFEPQAAMAGRVMVSRSPWTYLNRILLKKRFRRTIEASVTRERTFSAEK